MAGESSRSRFSCPIPISTMTQNYVDEPDWSRLYLWDSLTHKYLGRGHDPMDRLAPKFFHG